MAYIEGKKEAGCVLCRKVEGEDDRASLVVYRGRLVYVIMNLYPYNPGHLMIAPYAHVSELGDLPEAALGELMGLARHGTEVLRRVMAPDGFNLGMNLGEIAGAGIADHLHMHVVPRWAADTNFMPVIGETRVLPEELPATYDKLRAAWGEVA
jgi:ATP adenylyltransferase